MMPLLLLQNWKLLAIAAVLVASFFAGWTVNGWRWEGKANAMQAAWSDAATKASEEARAKEKQLSDTIAELDAKHSVERKKADEETNRLRSAVNAGSNRLRVNATCPTNSLPSTSPSSGVDTGTGAVLTADAGSAYFDLRTGLTRLGSKLSACQGLLRSERK